MSTLTSGWERFWFAPQSTAPVELFRIAYGILVSAWMLTMIPVFAPFFGPGAAVPATPSLGIGTWTLFTLVHGSPLVWVILVAGLVSALALVVGYRTRLAAVVVFVVLVSLTRQAPLVFNYGDALIRVLAFYVMFMPAGSAVSIDRRSADPSGTWTFPRRAPWALRLAQIQLSALYLSTFWEKTGGSLWRDGTAVSYALRIGNVNRIPMPEFLTDSTVLMQLATYGTLAAEAAIGILVWNRAARPWVLALGVLLHLSIDASFLIGFFSLAMLTLYLVFVPPEAAERLFDVLHRRLRIARRAAGGRGEPPTVHADGTTPRADAEPESASAQVGDPRTTDPGDTAAPRRDEAGEGDEPAAPEDAEPGGVIAPVLRTVVTQFR